MSTVLVHSCTNHPGDWDVELPERGARVTLKTIDEARRIALGAAAQAPPCEVIVRDAYDRVLQREFIDRTDGE